MNKEISKSTFFEGFRFRCHLLIFFIMFPFTLINNGVHVVHVNTSLAPSPLIRDAFFILISRLFRKSILVFIHGWNVECATKLQNSKFTKILFKNVYNLADVILVLAHDFKDNLEHMGITKKIIVETTMVDDSCIDSNTISKHIHSHSSNKRMIFLFLSRIVKSKGIYETVDAFNILSKKQYNVELKIAGDGPELNAVKKYVKNMRINNIEFLGNVTGDNKTNIFLKSDVFLLPSHGEGLPISVLEAMAFGLPVVTRSVGGLADFFIDGKHGFITKSNSPYIFAGFLEKLITDNILRNEIAKYNHKYAIENFMASKVTKRIEKIYKNLIENKTA